MTAKKSITSLNCLLLVLIFLVGTCNVINGQNGPAFKYSSGDDEIDRIREEINAQPSDESNFEIRALMLGL